MSSPPPRLAIATPAKDAWSETFIAAHIERLHEVVLVLTNGSLPRTDGSGTPVLAATPADRLARSIGQRIMGRPVAEVLRRRIAHRLRRERVHVVLAEYGPTGEELLWSCQRAGVPLVVHFHGYDAHQAAPLARHANYRRTIAGAAALVVVSRAMERQLLGLGAPREKVVLNPYGVDLARFPIGDPARSSPRFTAVGRFVDKKAPHLLIEAFRLVLAERPEARLTMAGHGPLWESCDRLVAAAGLADRIELPGVLAPGEVASLMRSSRAFVQHSVTAADGDSEGTPLAVLEAMASGVPVAATAHAGIADVVAHEERGLLCAEGDARTMARHIIRLVDDPALAGRMGSAGRAHVERHHRVEDRVAVLQDLLQRVARA